MRKIFLLLALALSTFSLLRANDKPRPNHEADFRIVQDGAVVKVLYRAESHNDVKIFIYDAKNGKVFSEMLNNTKGFIRPYDLSNLPLGKYMVVVWDGNYEFRKSFDVYPGTKPTFIDVDKVAGAKQKFLLRVAKAAGGYTLKIKDQNDVVVFVEERKVADDFAQLYDISKLKGHVTIELSDFAGNSDNLTF